ncbi:hypothetical protein [Actinomadura rayongensis]|nr:hypothetical protein [Actinomadura rayongensis]
MSAEIFAVIIRRHTDGGRPMPLIQRYDQHERRMSEPMPFLFQRQLGTVRRRQARPADEYRPVTQAEWLGFEEHFDQRKVELGGCARPYATACQHEHACLRCPMININPKMLPRLDEIELDLLARRSRAEAEGWLGEIEGIDLTLSFLRQKRDQTRRLARVAPVDLGIPTLGGRAS